MSEITAEIPEVPEGTLEPAASEHKETATLGEDNTSPGADFMEEKKREAAQFRRSRRSSNRSKRCG